jgi:hypothetical protein
MIKVDEIAQEIALQVSFYVDKTNIFGIRVISKGNRLLGLRLQANGFNKH